MTAAEFSQVTSQYEKSLSLSEKKDRGIFYTDLSLAEKVIEHLSIPKNATVLDPCCGTGSFNYAAVKYGVNRVYGADIDGDALGICRKYIPQGIFIQSDSIELEAQAFLSGFKGKKEKMDYVIGNPPYAKWVPSGWVSDAYNRKVSKSGNNLFVAALLRALELVKEGGIVSYIIPKNFLHVTKYGTFRKELLANRTILSIIDIGAYFKDVRGEQIILTLKNSMPVGHRILIKKLVNGVFQDQLEIRQDFYEDEIILFRDPTDFGLYTKLTKLDRLENVCRDTIRRGRSGSPTAVIGRDIRKFGYKTMPLPTSGNQIFIQNIYSTEAGIIAAFGGDGEAAETVTILTDGNEKECRLLLGILHSRLCNFFLYRYCYNCSRLTMHTDAKYLKKIPFPKLSLEWTDRISRQSLLIEEEPYLTDAWFGKMKKLDELVYEAYGLEATEQEYIDNEMKAVQSKKWK